MVKRMTKTEFIEWAKGIGWYEDKYGHLQKITPIAEKEYRFKIGKTSVRYEMKIHHPANRYSESKTEWMRLRSGYFKDLHIAPDGKLSGMTR